MLQTYISNNADASLSTKGLGDMNDSTFEAWFEALTPKQQREYYDGFLAGDSMNRPSI